MYYRDMRFKNPRWVRIKCREFIADSTLLALEKQGHIEVKDEVPTPRQLRQRNMATALRAISSAKAQLKVFELYTIKASSQSQLPGFLQLLSHIQQSITQLENYARGLNNEFATDTAKARLREKLKAQNTNVQSNNN